MDKKLETINLNLFYGHFHALKNVTMSVPPRAITAIIGPSGCGKSTLLRCFNRMNDLIPSARVEGRILLDSQDIHAPGANLPQLRKRVGMVFQRPNPFPLTVYENVAFGPRVHGDVPSAAMRDRVQAALEATALWDDLKDRLNDPALQLSPEQQQRLCISRTLAVGPEVILMDEPCSALDPIATDHIEDLMRRLAERYTIVIVTHNMQQAARVSSQTAFMLLGEMVEMGRTPEIFTAPSDTRTADYITGRYG